MEAIFEFFAGIGNVIQTAFKFLFSTIQDIVYVVKLTSKCLVRIPSYFSWLPSELLTIVVALFGIVVVYKILGREG